MNEWLYAAISIPTGLAIAYWAWNAFIYEECFEDDAFNGFFDFVMGCFFLALALASGMLWPIILPLGALIGGLYYIYWATRKENRKAKTDVSRSTTFQV